MLFIYSFGPFLEHLLCGRPFWGTGDNGWPWYIPWRDQPTRKWMSPSQCAECHTWVIGALARTPLSLLSGEGQGSSMRGWQCKLSEIRKSEANRRKKHEGKDLRERAGRLGEPCASERWVRAPCVETRQGHDLELRLLQKSNKTCALISRDQI